MESGELRINWPKLPRGSGSDSQTVLVKVIHNDEPARVCLDTNIRMTTDFSFSIRDGGIQCHEPRRLSRQEEEEQERAIQATRECFSRIEQSICAIRS